MIARLVDSLPVGKDPYQPVMSGGPLQWEILLKLKRKRIESDFFDAPGAF